MLLRSRLAISTLIAASMLSLAGRARAQNTAPVPSTFSIVTPDDGNAASLINSDYSVNKKIFFGGDFAYTGDHNSRGFKGFQVGGDVEATRKARGNKTGSRLTLGGMEGGTDATYPTFGSSYVTNLGSFVASFTSYDYDDLGFPGVGASPQAVTFPDYRGSNGFIAINEGDTLEINISGFIDPNNSVQGGAVDGDNIYTGRGFKSAAGDGIAGNLHDDNVTYDILYKPAGATFTSNGQFRWVPNFLQGNGNTDDSQRNNYWFIDANISNGSTGSETTPGNEGSVGPGNGELKDSLYVIYFKAIDDSGQGNESAYDSLFILVNDSIANPPPVFTQRNIKLANGSTINWDSSSVQYANDSLLTYSEGDSIVITFNATDKDSAYGGGENQALTFNVPNWSDFIKRPSSHVDSVALKVDTVKVNGSTRGLKVTLQVAYNVSDTVGAGAKDTVRLVVTVDEASNDPVPDTMLFFINNVNRPPIWDSDTTSKPSDSALTYSNSPSSVEPGTIQSSFSFAINNDQINNTYFSQYVYDPDLLAADSTGLPLTFSASAGVKGTLNSTTGLDVYFPNEADTVTYSFTVTATDGHPTSPKSAGQTVKFRVAPAPTITSVEPASGSPGQEFVITGSGFGLYDNSNQDTSRVQFYATTNGVRQNLDANIIAWSKSRIVASVPEDASASGLDSTQSYLVPDTIIVRSAIFGAYDTYPFVVFSDTAGVENLEVVNITSNSAMIRYRTNLTGADSAVVATSADSLDIHSGNFSLPTFVEVSGAALTQIQSTVQVFQDATNSLDRIHVIQLSDLAPGTRYRFFIGAANDVYFADTLRNENGPFAPKKIDTSTLANNSNLTAFRFRTLPSSSGPGDQFYTVTGKAYYSSGAATDATVTLKVVSLADPADTSLPLSTTVNSDSTWLLELGNLHGTDGSNFAHAAGDYMLLEIDGAEKGFEQYDTTRASASSMTVRKIKLQKYLTYTLEFMTGLNLIGLPVKLYKGQPTTAEGLLDLVEGGSPSITRYVTLSGSQETITRSIDGAYIGADDFTLQTQQGYFLQVSSATDINLEGRVYTDALPVVNFQGPGLYFITNPAQDNNLYYSWDAKQILQTIAQVSTVYRFNSTLQSYETYTRIGTTLNGTNFPFAVGEGYILELSAAGSWNPSGPGGLLASTGGSAETGSSTVIVVDIGDKSGQIAPAAMKLSNVTSSAAFFTWGTGSTDPGQLRLSLADGSSETLIRPTPDKLTGGMSYALVTGLKPEKQYFYRLESSAGIPLPAQVEGSFSTAKVGASMNPYSLYGRLVDASGNPLGGMLVLVRLSRETESLQSGYLSAVSDERGYWVLNLANLKVKDTGEVYEWREGDRIELTVTSGAYSAVFFATAKPGSPHNVALDLEQSGQTDQNAQDKQPVSLVLPKAYALSQNFPNPFNPSTTIQFSIPEGGGSVKVRLDIFNIRGQVVATLVDRTVTAGEYNIQWDGSDSAGRSVSSGVYFYRLTTPEYKATRKMVILK